MVMEAIGTAPAEFTFHARNPANHRRIGGRNMTISLVSSPPMPAISSGARRQGSLEDCENFFRLAQTLNIVDFAAGYPMEPTDVPTPIRHLKTEYALATLTDKPLYGYPLGSQRIRDSIELTRIARSIDEAPSLPTSLSVWPEKS